MLVAMQCTLALLEKTEKETTSTWDILHRNFHKEEEEDVDSSDLVRVEVWLGRHTDDVCSNEIVLTAGPDTSGTGKSESFILDDGHVAFIMREGKCIFFGDA